MEEWRRGEGKDEGGEDEDEEADNENAVIKRQSDVIFYDKVLALGKAYRLFQLIELGWVHACWSVLFFFFSISGMYNYM